MAAVLPASEIPSCVISRGAASRSAIGLTAALWVYAFILLLWFSQGWGNPSAREFVVTWSPIPAELMALGLLLPLLRAMPAGCRRTGWMLLTAATISDIAANVWWALESASPASADYPWVDAPYFLYYPLTAAAYWMFYRELGGLLRSRAALLDAATLGLGFGATLWLYLMLPQIEQTGWNDPAMFNLVAFCIGNGALMVLMSMMIMQVLDWRSEGGLLLAGAAALCAFTTDLQWLETGKDYFLFDTWSNIGGYSLHFALLGTGAFLERHWRIPATVRVLGGNRYSVLPILSVLAAVGMLYGGRARLSGIEWIVPAGFALTGVLLVVARQQGVRNEIRRLSQALASRDAQAHLTELIRRSSDLVVVVDASMQPSFVSPACEKVLGFPADSLMSRSAPELLGGEHRERLRAFLTDLAAVPGQRREMELIVLGADRERRALQVLGSNQLHNPAIAGLTLTVRDVTARRRLEREVLEVGLLERERLAGEIRGSLGSELEKVKHLVAGLRATADSGGDGREPIAAAVAQVNHSIDVARRLSMRLSPLHVARGALDVAVGSLCADFAQRWSVAIDFQCDRVARGVNAEEADHVYRVVQELLDHMMHADARAGFAVRLRGEAGLLHVSVRERAPSADRVQTHNPFALRLAAYRAHVLGGTLRRHSRAEGSRVEVTIPLIR